MQGKIGHVPFVSLILRVIFVLSVIMIAISATYIGLDYAFNIGGFPGYYMSVENGFRECYTTEDEYLFTCYKHDGIHHDPDMESKTLNGDEYYCYTATRGGLLSNYYTACVEIASMNQNANP